MRSDIRNKIRHLIIRLKEKNELPRNEEVEKGVPNESVEEAKPRVFLESRVQQPSNNAVRQVPGNKSDSHCNDKVLDFDFCDNVAFVIHDFSISPLLCICWFLAIYIKIPLLQDGRMGLY